MIDNLTLLSKTNFMHISQKLKVHKYERGCFTTYVCVLISWHFIKSKQLYSTTHLVIKPPILEHGLFWWINHIWWNRLSCSALEHHQCSVWPTPKNVHLVTRWRRAARPSLWRSANTQIQTHKQTNTNANTQIKMSIWSLVVGWQQGQASRGVQADTCFSMRWNAQIQTPKSGAFLSFFWWLLLHWDNIFNGGLWQTDERCWQFLKEHRGPGFWLILNTPQILLLFSSGLATLMENHACVLR